MATYYQDSLLVGDTYADMRAFPWTDKGVMFVLGQNAPNDGGQCWWWYSETSMDVDNGTTVIKPNIIPTGTPGRWLRVVGQYNTLNSVPPGIAPTINAGLTKTLNTPFTVNTKTSVVWYGVRCQVTNPLLVGSSTASAFLEYSTNGGTSWSLLGQSGNESNVGVTVAVQLTNGQTGTLSAPVPAGALVRIRTATTGTASVTFVSGSGVEMIFN